MKFPSPQLSTEQLEQLFQKSAYVDRLFCPRQVPERPYQIKETSELKDFDFTEVQSDE